MHHRERFRVLIADPDPRRARHVGFALEMSGLFTATVGDAEALVASVREQSPHLILLDLRLPGPGGDNGSLQAAARLRDERLLDATPVFGLADGRDRALAAAAEFELDRVLCRPVPIVDLVAAIHATHRRLTTTPRRSSAAAAPVTAPQGTVPAARVAVPGAQGAVPVSPGPALLVQKQKQALVPH